MTCPRWSQFVISEGGGSGEWKSCFSSTHPNVAAVKTRKDEQTCASYGTVIDGLQGELFLTLANLRRLCCGVLPQLFLRARKCDVPNRTQESSAEIRFCDVTPRFKCDHVRNASRCPWVVISEATSILSIFKKELQSANKTKRPQHLENIYKHIQTHTHTHRAGLRGCPCILRLGPVKESTEPRAF